MWLRDFWTECACAHAIKSMNPLHVRMACRCINILYLYTHTSCQFVIVSNLLLIALQYRYRCIHQKLNPKVNVFVSCCFFFVVWPKKKLEKNTHTVNHMHDRLSTHFINWADSIRNIYLGCLLIGSDGNGREKEKLKSNSHLVIVCTIHLEKFVDVNAFLFQQHHTKPPIAATTTIAHYHTEPKKFKIINLKQIFIMTNMQIMNSKLLIKVCLTHSSRSMLQLKFNRWRLKLSFWLTYLFLLLPFCAF